MTGIYGQDWASYQGSVPSASGLAFVFLKVTEGLTYESPVWKSQKADAVSHGAVVGYYHYPHMHNSAHTEVDFFLSKVKPAIGEMVVLDWEGYDANNTSVPKSEQLAYKESYLTYMKLRVPNNPVGMYCNTDYWYNVDTTGHAGDFLWIATSGLPAGQPGIKAVWTFHQYGAAGVDKDYGNFSSQAALKAWIASFNKTIPTPPEDIVTPQDKKDIIDGVLAQLPAAIWNYSLTRRDDNWNATADKPNLQAHWFVEGLDIDFRAVQGKLAEVEAKVEALTPKA